MLAKYNAKHHPDVKTGKRSEDEVLMEFLDTFEQHHAIRVSKRYNLLIFRLEISSWETRKSPGKSSWNTTIMSAAQLTTIPTLNLWWKMLGIWTMPATKEEPDWTSSEHEIYKLTDFFTFEYIWVWRTLENGADLIYKLNKIIRK